MGKSSRHKKHRSSGPSGTGGSLLKRVQHALASAYETDDPVAEKLLYETLLPKLTSDDSSGWLRRLEQSLCYPDAPPSAYVGWQHWLSTAMLLPSHTHGDPQPWTSLAVLVHVDNPLDPTRPALVEDQRLDDLDTLADAWSTLWLGEPGRVRISQEWSQTYLDPVAMFAKVHQAPHVRWSLDERRAFNAQIRATYDDSLAALEQHHHDQTQGEMHKSIEAMIQAAAHEEMADGTAGLDDPYGQTILLHLRVALRPGNVPMFDEHDLGRFIALINHRDWTLTWQDADGPRSAPFQVEEVGEPLDLFERVDLYEPLNDLNGFLDQHLERLGGSWDNVQAIMYPVILDEDDDPSLAALINVHVVLWATALNTMVGAHELDLYVPMTDIVRIGQAIGEALQEHGLANVQVLPPQPSVACEGCGAPMFLTPGEDWVHPEDDEGPGAVPSFPHPAPPQVQ